MARQSQSYYRALGRNKSPCWILNVLSMYFSGTKSKRNDPPRPPNAFFLFRNALNSHLSALNLRVPQVSMAAGKLWVLPVKKSKVNILDILDYKKLPSQSLTFGNAYVYRPRKTLPPKPSHSSSSERMPPSLSNTHTFLPFHLILCPIHGAETS